MPLVAGTRGAWLGRWLPICGALLILVIVGRASAQDLEEELSRPTLKGLPGIFLLINTPSQMTAAERGSIITETELTLRSAGVKLYTRDEFAANPTLPTLLISFSSTKAVSQGAPVSWGCNVELMQGIFLERNPAVYSSAVTWRTPASFGFGPEDSVSATARSEIGRRAKAFANAFLAANGK